MAFRPDTVDRDLANWRPPRCLVLFPSPLLGIYAQLSWPTTTRTRAKTPTWDIYRGNTDSLTIQQGPS